MGKEKILSIPLESTRLKFPIILNSKKLKNGMLTLRTQSFFALVFSIVFLILITAFLFFSIPLVFRIGVVISQIFLVYAVYDLSKKSAVLTYYIEPKHGELNVRIWSTWSLERDFKDLRIILRKFSYTDFNPAFNVMLVVTSEKFVVPFCLEYVGPDVEYASNKTKEWSKLLDIPIGDVYGDIFSELKTEDSV